MNGTTGYMNIKVQVSPAIADLIQFSSFKWCISLVRITDTPQLEINASYPIFYHQDKTIGIFFVNLSELVKQANL